MSLLCGWVTRRPVDDPQDSLNAMMACPVPPVGARVRAVSEPDVGLGVLTAGAGDLHCEEGLYVAIEGSSFWRDSRYQALAKSEGPARALFLAYRDFGDRVLEHVSGPCSLAIIDRANDRAIVAIDRLGVRPLCFASLGSKGIVFGSTTDSVRAHPFVETTLDYQALSDFLFFTRVPAPETIFSQIGKLMPGQYLRYRNGEVEVDFYWKLSYRGGETGDRPTYNELAVEFRELLDRAFDRALDGVDPTRVGAFLSGGVDSSTLVGLLAQRHPETATAFTIGFDVPGYDEFEFARVAARHFRVKQREYVVTPDDIVAAAPKLAAIYDEPFANTSAVAAYYCARLAKQNGMDVLLAGDGGDELLAGNSRYATQRVFEAYRHVPEVLRRNLIEPLFSESSSEAWLIRKGRSYIRQATVPLPERLEINNNYLSFSLTECFPPEFASRINQRHGLDLMRFHFDAAEAGSRLNRMLHLDMRTTLADDDLRKVGRTCDLAQIEARFPLLSEDLTEFSGRVPPNLKLKVGKLRYFNKRALRDFLPPSTLGKKKQGFGLPFGVWLKTERRLQEFTYDMLKGLAGRGILAPAFPDAAIERHRTGHPSFHGELVWILLMLELWLQSRVGQDASSMRADRFEHLPKTAANAP